MCSAPETNTFSAGEEHVENAYSNFSHTHTASYMYQQVPNKTYVKIIVTHRYSLPKTGSSYFTLLLTSVYATHTTVFYLHTVSS